MACATLLEHRVQHEDMTLPEDLGQPVDDALRAIVLRCIARDPASAWPRPATCTPH